MFLQHLTSYLGIHTTECLAIAPMVARADEHQKSLVVALFRIYGRLATCFIDVSTCRHRDNVIEPAV